MQTKPTAGTNPIDWMGELFYAPPQPAHWLFGELTPQQLRERAHLEAKFKANALPAFDPWKVRR